LTITKDGERLIFSAVTALTGANAYTAPRSAWVDITANNITKRININQRPDVGTISVDASRLVFCPVTHTYRDIQITSTGAWSFLDNSAAPKATPNISSGTGNATVRLTRTTTGDEAEFDKYYGDGTIIVRNDETLEQVTISLVNCFIFMDENTINANAPTGAAQTAVTVSSDIKVYGGSKNLVFGTKSSWIHNGISWNPTTQQLTFTTDREPDDEPRYGFMNFSHAECSDYTVNATVYQDIIITIPEFDYFVVKFTWPSGDVDIRVGFDGNPTSVVVNGQTYSTPMVNQINNKWVGYSSQGTGQYITRTRTNNTTINLYYVKDPFSANRLLEWGGDATGGQGETVFFNAPLINSAPYPGQSGIATNNPNLLPRKLTLRVNASWYSSTSSGHLPITCTIYCYRGGVMNWDGWSNFVNSGGTNVLPSTLSRVYYSTSSAWQNYHVADITYDRVKHTATVQWFK